jgi:alkanesulfonate monooxygenase SsuD/methylene tetrahydromethanopterin reductase-like flavin-dependent oxidoreductase (luciferase family)
VQLTDARCEPKPVQRPHPPIVIGGRGPKRTLGAVARWGQGWNVILDDPQQWLALKQTLTGHCAAIGRDPAEIDCSVNVMVSSLEGIEAALDKAAAFGAAGADLVILNLPHGVPPHFVETLAARIAARPWPGEPAGQAPGGS